MDLLFASIAAIGLAALAFYAYETSDVAMRSYDLRAELSSAAGDAANAIVQSPGVPSNWTRFGKIDSAQISGLGLAIEQGVLDAEKTAFFFNAVNASAGNSNHSNASFLLGLRRRGFDYSLSVFDAAGATLYSTNASTTPPSNNTVSTERLAVLGGSAVRVKLSVWTVD
ncbi:MAG: hypothetical protein WC792_00090 [Candidatus Micrarchaeia archaeon]|jgi:hypothetical protein